MKSIVRLVIFDLDGTLIDTVRMTAPAIREVAGRCHLPVPTEAAVRDAMGLHDSQFYPRLLPDATGAQLEALAVDVERREGEIASQLGARILFDGVAEMLERMQALGFTMCIASTGSRAHVRDMLDCSGIRERFSGIWCDAADKTAMTGEILAAHTPCDAVYVGDTAIDVRAARRNGICVYGAGFGYVKPHERMLFDAVADTPDALLALLTQRRR